MGNILERVQLKPSSFPGHWQRWSDGCLCSTCREDHRERRGRNIVRVKRKLNHCRGGNNLIADTLSIIFCDVLILQPLHIESGI